ncbi:ABC transporter permease [Streptomyces sp. SID13666]|uniref:ABC transporter permease n=1 Tax=Streptomyces TaxID=1883 RepID=UPI001106AD43|nr:MULTISPECIES: ABC transporter permease [Streptomyces]NEA55664.1 ABC transporter permease [Streptomyces sp. SID13666]NEA73267.1 ABC transporter permease [Streptomyces sp. SID13588]QNA74106.1 ABC transporter permease [Streptomyces sp. So13.3]
MSTTRTGTLKGTGTVPATGPRTRSRTRLVALGRAELTLLWRNRTAMYTALLLPVGMVWATRSVVPTHDLREAGLTRNAQTMSGGIGVILLLVVYYNLVTAYVARREELVLKRLRTGEPSDLEILAGTALPAAAVALAQCTALIATGALLLDLPAPRRPELLVAGVLLGVLLLAALAAVSTVFTRSVEVAQLTTLPLFMVSLIGSGLFVPVELLPGWAHDLCRLLPVTPVTDLVRFGWLGGAGAGEILRTLGLAVAWTALAVFAVRRWFRWEPRR